MKRSTDRILTTHVGSLARPDALIDMMWARERGDGFDNAQSVGSNTPEGQFKSVVGELRNQLKQSDRWSLPSWGSQDCKIRHLTPGGNIDVEIDLNSPIDVSTGSPNSVVMFQCPGSTQCIDNISGSDAAQQAMELKSSTGPSAVSKIAEMRDKHPICQ